jgi:hypothetical protein
MERRRFLGLSDELQRLDNWRGEGGFRRSKVAFIWVKWRSDDYLLELLSGYSICPNMPSNYRMQRHGKVVLNAFLIHLFGEGKVPLTLSVVGITTDTSFAIIQSMTAM